MRTTTMPFIQLTSVSFILLFFIILITLLILTWYFHSYLNYKKQLKHFNQVNLFSHLPKNGAEMYKWLLSLSNKYGKNFWSMIGPVPVLFTSDPEVFSLVLKSPNHIKKPFFYRTVESSVKDTIFLVNGQEWRRQRHMMKPAFDYSLMIQTVSVFNEYSDITVDHLKVEVSQKSCDLKKYVEKYSFDSFCDGFLGTIITKNSCEFMENMHFIFKVATLRHLQFIEIFYLTYIFTKNFWKERKVLRSVFNICRRILNERSKAILKNENPSKKSVFLDLLLKDKIINPSIPEENYVKQIAFMEAAGFHTTPLAISYALYELSKNPDIQTKVFEEVISIIGDNIHQSISYQQLTEMKYLDLVIKETLRMYCIVPMYARQFEEDVIFKETVLPKGLVIVMLPYIMHKNPDLYPEPEKFIPERFLPENLPPNQFAYAPFSLGVRQCLGKKFAELAIKVFLAKMILKYELINVNHELSFAIYITLNSESGIKIGLKNRLPIKKFIK